MGWGVIERMDLATALPEALALAPGSKPELLATTLTAYFKNTLPRDVWTSHFRMPEDADRAFRHLAPGSWAAELVAQKLNAMAFDRILALGFKDARFEDVETFAAINEIPLARILHARAGADSFDTLNAFASRGKSTRWKHSALAAACVAATGAVPAGVEAGFDLTEIGWEPLQRAALEALGAERAGEVVLRTLRKFDAQPEFRVDGVVPVLTSFGAPLPASTLEAVGQRIEELRAGKYEHKGWEMIGEWLGRSQAWHEALAFMDPRATAVPGWKRAIRALLAEAVLRGFTLAPEHDRHIDPAGGVKDGVWDITLRLLSSLPPGRAAVLLTDAPFEKPADLFRYVLAGMPPALLTRYAELHVSLRDEPDAKDLLIVTRLQHLGPDFGVALKVALADVKPKKGYLKALERNLEAPVYASIASWLETRPEPKKKKKAAAKKTAV